jgi:hypothetical protein
MRFVDWQSLIVDVPGSQAPAAGDAWLEVI